MIKHKVVRLTTIPFSFNTILKGQLKYISNYYEVFFISSDDTDFNQVILNENVRGIRVNMTRRITPLSDLFSLIKICFILIRENPIIVHTQTPKAGFLGSVAAWICRIPVRIHTVGGLPLLEANGLRRRLLSLVERITYSCASHVYPNSFGLKEIIIQNKLCNPNKLKVLANGSSNGIDTIHFNPSYFKENEKLELRNGIGISPDDFVFIFVGRLVGDKGINELVNVFSRITSENECFNEIVIQKSTNLKLVLVGHTEPDLDPLSKKTIKEINENPNIISLGFKADVRPFFAISNCLVFPSYREGFPNVVMQAGAMGLPSIVTDINGCNEIIIEGQNGTLIPVKDEKALSRAMKRILVKDSYYEHLKQNSRSLVVSRYEQNSVWNAILSEYNFLIKNV